MATYNKFQDFSEQVLRGVHNFGTGTFKVALTNNPPSATNTVFSDITEIAPGNGYTPGGETVTITMSETGGVTSVKAAPVTFQASAGPIGPFRYAVFYNSSATNKNLIGYFDYGSTITLQDAESIVARFNNENPGQIFQLS